MEERRVEVNPEAMSRLQERLKDSGVHKVAVISVVGAFHTGKSFLLDLFLRYLRHEDVVGPEAAAREPRPPSRGGADGGADGGGGGGGGGDAPFAPPAWLTSAGSTLEGASARAAEGFRFRGGMGHCTEGIWVWSEPFIRVVHDHRVAILLMDTQGAWDGNMTKEQSATLFGLTALISSKTIYNISMQIQEDKVENLAYFMRFAQAALRTAASSSAPAAGGSRAGGPPQPAAAAALQGEVARPFQSIDFLVRDWPNFEDHWPMERCRQQMRSHLDMHLNPQRVADGSTAEALQSMFQHIGCFCLPHPGLHIQRASWTGAVADLRADFVRFVDEYVREVFSANLELKTILGSELTTVSLPLVIQNFVAAFQNAAPVAMSFTQAMELTTVLLAKEQAMNSYAQRMGEALARAPHGLEPQAFEDLHLQLLTDIGEEYSGMAILGSDETRTEAWASIQEKLTEARANFWADNARRIEKALVCLANISLLGTAFFVLDLASDWACDWWSQTCRDLSRLMFTAYCGIFLYLAYQVYWLATERGRFAAGNACVELWKEMVRLLGVYADLVSALQPSSALGLLKGLLPAAPSSIGGGGGAGGGGGSAAPAATSAAAAVRGEATLRTVGAAAVGLGGGSGGGSGGGPVPASGSPPAVAG